MKGREDSTYFWKKLKRGRDKRHNNDLTRRVLRPKLGGVVKYVFNFIQKRLTFDF